MEAFELSPDNKPDGPSPLHSGGQSIHDFPKEYQNLIHLFGSCSHMASSLHDRALSCVCVWHKSSCLCSKNYFWKCSWNPESWLIFTQCCLRAWRSRASSADVQWDVFRFSESFDDNMYHRWLNIQSHFCWGTLFWNCSTICGPIFISGKLCLSKVLFFIPNHVTDLFPVNLINCNMFLQLFLFRTTYFSSLYFPCSNLFLRNAAAIKIDLVYQKPVECLTFSIWYVK